MQSPSLRLIACAAMAGMGLLAAGAAPQVLPPPRPIPPPIDIRPLQGIAIAAVEIRALVQNGVAHIDITHLLANRSGVPQEGDFVFPIPSGATVREFALYDGETKLPAQLLDRNQALATYEEIVRRRRDPALLTYAGQAALRARVFPIAPHAERRLSLKLALVLPREGDSRKLAWPLIGAHLPPETGGNPARPERIAVHLTFKGAGNVYSPTHAIALRRDPDGTAVATWSSEKDGAALSEHPEIAVYVTPKDPRPVALSALAYNAALPQVASLGGGMRQSGYFLIVASPNLPDAARVAPPRRVVLVMDRSGSMAGKKIEQARGALKIALGKLRAQDRFNLLTFSDRVERFAPEPVAASPDNLKRATAFVDDIAADGGTNIHEALLDGLKQFPEASRGNTLLFFTDGLPTVGVRDQSAIVRAARDANGRKARAFVFGVGYDVDVPFLDTVAEKLRGDADYVRPDEDIEVKTSRFVAKTSTPVLENLALSVAGANAGEIYPKPDDLPDLFDGGQLVLVGRYTGEGQVKIALRGEVGGKPQTFGLETTFPAVATEADFLPRLWASRKIGYLTDEVRLAADEARKKEIVEQIVVLSKEFGILTPYTGLFVPEPGTADGRAFFRGAAPGIGGGGLPAGPTADLKAMRVGEEAVNLSQGGRAQRNAGIAGNSAYVVTQAGLSRARSEAAARRIQNVAARTFFQNGALWQDVTYDEKKQTEVVRIKLYSPAYFALLRRNDRFARWAALGREILIVANAKQAVQFGEEGRTELSEKEISALAGR